jgi:hypothetical protein
MEEALAFADGQIVIEISVSLIAGFKVLMVVMQSSVL